jgi:hypothetical protein
MTSKLPFIKKPQRMLKIVYPGRINKLNKLYIPKKKRKEIK